MQYFKELGPEDQSHQLPTTFTNPFDYAPHPLCIKAAAMLQQNLPLPSSKRKGKMYGVLVVKNKVGKIGFLSAYSGNDKEMNSTIKFVPQVFDLTNHSSFFRIGENELNKMNLEIRELENNSELKTLKLTLPNEQRQAEEAINEAKGQMVIAKAYRDKKRKAISQNKNDIIITAQLIKESQTEKSHFKKLKINWANKIAETQVQIKSFDDEINKLKSIRKTNSAQLQQRLFEQYCFLNQQGDFKNASEIFRSQPSKVPPAGAGDCAAPKLLQFAFKEGYTPIVMAEFWWGESPKTEIRKHGYFYPACKSKCKPILAHMLKGLTIEDSHISSSSKILTIIFEDETIAVINKPCGLLSVPGKEVYESVYSQIKDKSPNATGPLIVHRLDMATSGLMVIAKSKAAHEVLQKQFLNKTIKKRYVAWLDGIIHDDEGTINLPIRVDLDDRPRQLVCYNHGKAALTKWKVLERIKGQTKVHFFPITGRTHQLRVHSAHHLGLNTPIVGDGLYGKKGERLTLHAERIEFIHPANNELLTFTHKPDF